MDSIKKVGRNIWLVNGKVIGSAYDSTFDDSTPEGRAILIDVADNTCSGPLFPRAGNPLYAAFFKPCAPGTGGRFVFVGQPHIRKLPEDVRSRLREELSEHASEF